MVVLINFPNTQLQTIPNVQQIGLFKSEKTFKMISGQCSRNIGKN